MKLICGKNGIFFKGVELKKGDIIEVENKEFLGPYGGLFKELVEKENIEKEKTTKKNKSKTKNKK